ncbi:MAG: hypothetical protein FWE20_13090 [Defluviitaleaceae bacterium]|nr:hypothetical protein [Defluviitaleaceae bacterium]
MGAEMYKGWTRVQLLEELERLQELVRKLGGEAVVHKSNNERGAGRKPTLTRALVADVKALKGTGVSFREISKSLGVSLGLAHKAYHLSDDQWLRTECMPDQISIFDP